MKKIISILLMLSMVFSLVACSTEPASDVVDNDNADVSGEGLENVIENIGINSDESSNTFEGSIWWVEYAEDLDLNDGKIYEDGSVVVVDFWDEDIALVQIVEETNECEYVIENDKILFSGDSVKYSAYLEDNYLVLEDEISRYYLLDVSAELEDTQTQFDQAFELMTKYIWYIQNYSDVQELEIFKFNSDGTVIRKIYDKEYLGTWERRGDQSIDMYFDSDLLEATINLYSDTPEEITSTTITIDGMHNFTTVRNSCVLSETVWEISALEDKNGNRTDSPAPLTFEFTSETGGKFTQPEKIDNVALDKEIGGTLLNIDNLSGLAESFVLTGEFFEKYNNDGSDKAEVTITENEMIISTDVQNFVFDYSGVRTTTVLQDMSLVLDEVYDERITVLSEDGRTGLERFYVEENKLELFLGADGTAELSNGAETLTGTWDYDDVLIGPDGGYINISSDIFDIESNPEFFANLLIELKNIDGQIEWSVDSSLDAYPGNVTSEEMWFDLGDTRFSFVQDTDFNHFATIDNSFN